MLLTCLLFLSGELEEDASLRQLAKDLKISVLTAARAYNELDEEGFITSRQDKGFFVMSSGSNLIREQCLELKSVCKGFRDFTLNNISFTLPQGYIIANVALYEIR